MLKVAAVFALLQTGARGQPVPPAPPTLFNEMNDVFNSIAPNNPASVSEAEDKLVALGADKIFQAELTVKRRQVVELAGTEHDLGEIPKLQSQCEALDGALVRLEWQVNPREEIAKFIQGATPAAKWQYNLQRVTDTEVARVFPTMLLYSVIFRQYPVARILPPSMAAQNLFVIRKGGKLEHLADAKRLENFFRAGLPRPDSAEWLKTDDGRKTIVRAWLRLTQEFSQDGMFEFSIPQDSISIEAAKEGWTGKGKVMVAPKHGDSGEVVASLSFKSDGGLANISEKRTVRAGIRPKCQATKLLDADSVVRAMAEQDILVMGSAAEWYLAERHSQATLDSKFAIEQIWRRIQAEKW